MTFRPITILLLFISLGAMLASCRVVETPTLVEQLSPEELSPPAEYRMMAGDELEIRFFDTPEHNVILPIRPDGFVSIPLAREMKAAGRTPEQLAIDITDSVGRSLRDPEVAVIVRTFSAYRIHVGGEVDQAGIFELNRPMTVLDGLFVAGGVLPSARLGEVLVVRRKPDNSVQVIAIDVRTILDGTKPEQNIALLPYDAVFVPRSTIANVNVWVDQYIRRNIPISFGIRPDLQ